MLFKEFLARAVTASGISVLALGSASGGDVRAADTRAGDRSLEGMAERLMAACFEYAAAHSWPPLSVAVVDESGTLVSFRRQNKANPLTADVAVLKAQTAAHTRLATLDLASELLHDPAARDTFVLLHLAAIPGGVPLFRSDASILGAVGVSGAEPLQDAECARRAVASATGEAKR